MVPTKSNAISRGFRVKFRISVRVRIRFGWGAEVSFKVRIRFRENTILNGIELCPPTRLVVQDCVCVCVCG